MSAFDGLLNGLIAGVGGAAGTGANILQQDRENAEKEKQLQLQADISEKKQQALLEFQQHLTQTTADQNAARQHAYNMKAGQEVDAEYAKQTADQDEPDDRQEMLRAKADIAMRLGHRELASDLRQQQKDMNEEIKANAAMINAENERKFRTSAAGQHAPAEAQMVEFIASKVLGDTSQAGYKKAFALVKQSKGKSVDEQRANLAANLIKSQYMKPDEAKRVAAQLFPAEADDDQAGAQDGGVKDWTEVFKK